MIWFENDWKFGVLYAAIVQNRSHSHSHTGDNECAEGTKDELDERMQNAKGETK